MWLAGKLPWLSLTSSYPIFTIHLLLPNSWRCLKILSLTQPVLCWPLSSFHCIQRTYALLPHYTIAPCSTFFQLQADQVSQQRIKDLWAKYMESHPEFAAQVTIMCSMCHVFMQHVPCLHAAYAMPSCSMCHAFKKRPSQRVRKLASKLYVHSINRAAKLVHTRCALSSTVINSQQEPISGQACNPLDPHWFFLSFSRWRSFTVLGTKVAPFPYLMWGVIFTACVVYTFSRNHLAPL